MYPRLSCSGAYILLLTHNFYSRPIVYIIYVCIDRAYIFIITNMLYVVRFSQLILTSYLDTNVSIYTDSIID